MVARLLVCLAVTTVATVATVATVPSASAHDASYYWLRPYAELMLVKKQVRGVKPIIDARCTGAGQPRRNSRGVPRWGHFGCRVLTNVGGPYPWVAVYVHVTGPTTFRVSVS